MPPDDDEQTGDIEAQAAGAVPVSTAAQSIIDSPEYKELLKQNRKLARDAGSAKAAEQAARAEAAQIRQVAEAQQQAAQEQQIADILGDEGVAEWNAIAELAGTDQVGAARRLKALLGRTVAQSPATDPVAAAAASTPPDASGATVDASTSTPPTQPMRGVEADSPLTTMPTDQTTQIIEKLEGTYSDAVKRNQDPSTRNRMTTRDRAAGLIAYVGAAYLKAGARPKADR